jgi:hypothetical protein
MLQAQSSQDSIKAAHVSSASKRKGSGAERDVVAWLKANGYKYVDRRLAGATLDKGDISGIPGVTIEVKNHAKMDLAGWLAELEIEMKNDDAWTGAVIHKRKGKGDVSRVVCQYASTGMARTAEESRWRNIVLLHT